MGSSSADGCSPSYWRPAGSRTPRRPRGDVSTEFPIGGNQGNQGNQGNRGNRGMWASIARAIDDDAGGETRGAADAFVEALQASSTDASPSAPLVAWVSVRHLQELRASVPALYDRHRSVLDSC